MKNNQNNEKIQSQKIDSFYLFSFFFESQKAEALKQLRKLKLQKSIQDQREKKS